MPQTKNAALQGRVKAFDLDFLGDQSHRLHRPVQSSLLQLEHVARPCTPTNQCTTWAERLLDGCKQRA